ncbi:MAG: UDP-N-acetylmuramate dehydrogenase [Acidobacteriota bacterium]|nr:UDP-N-acetylmuramate dehydrogenase [Acidobacteriota bacterium]
MATTEETLRSLAAIPNLQISRDVQLARYTRFAIGGPADAVIETASAESFIAALNIARGSGLPYVVIGGGSNLIVSDEGFRGIVLKLSAHAICIDGTRIVAEGGAVLQDLVDATVAAGLAGIHTMTGIPGSVGAAVYGNAGAYGRSISESARQVRFFDGAGIRAFGNSECEFHYRESIFKKHKEWIILSVELQLERGDSTELKAKADGILAVRNEKYPPEMKCAGSIFKNYLLAELPEAVAEALPGNVIREGKVPSAYFLEQVGAKGMAVGDIHVATYHANLIYNAGHGTARDLVTVIGELKRRIGDRFGIPLEEEVQYVGRV